jgi:hypothetical protein
MNRNRRAKRDMQGAGKSIAAPLHEQLLPMQRQVAAAFSIRHAELPIRGVRAWGLSRR